jgi:hypothetical protein
VKLNVKLKENIFKKEKIMKLKMETLFSLNLMFLILKKNDFLDLIIYFF